MDPGYEVAYYLLFGLCLLWGRLIYLWLAAALIVGSVLYPPSPSGGVASHVISVLALSTPWIMGYLVARYKDRLPTIPVSLGLAIFAIGLVFDRCPLTREFYDVFRLCSFALCCCPLLLAIVQHSEGKAQRQYWVIRIPLAVAGVPLLWAVSPSLLIMKIGLSVVAVVAAITPLGVFDWLSRLTRWAGPSLVYIGSISYAVYALHAPIIAVIAHLLPTWPSAIKIVIFAVLLWALAHFMERIVQPIISRAVRGRRPNSLVARPS